MYTELKYIQSDGTQYIDTGHLFNNTDNLHLDFSVVRICTDDSNTNKHILSLKDDGVLTEKESAYFWLLGEKTLDFRLPTTSESWGFGYEDALNSTLSEYELTKVYIDFNASSNTVNGRSVTYYRDYINGMRVLRLLCNKDAVPTANIVRIYSFYIIRNGSLVLDCVPAQDDNGVVGLFDKISGTLYTSPVGNPFTAGPPAGKINSECMNYKSFINGLLKRCKHINGSDLDDTNKQKIYNCLVKMTNGMTSNLSSAITIRNAKKLLKVFSDRTIITDTDALYSNYALSKNTALDLINSLAPEERTFATLGDIYGSTEFNDYNYIQQRFYCVDENTTLNLKGTLYGGGGGGSGGAASDGSKNCSVYIQVKAGATGGTSTIAHGSTSITAAGGAGGAAHNRNITSDTDYPYRYYGSNGSSGATTAVDTTIDVTKTITITPGYGGGGSGGVAVKVSYGGSTFAGTAGSEYNGGNGGGANSFGDDSTFGGGGGYSGRKYVGKAVEIGTKGKEHQNNCAANNITWGSGWNKGRGGTGDGLLKSAASEVESQVEQPNTIGAGGYQGRAYYRDDAFNAGNGGNAGNNGGFVVDVSCANILIRFQNGINKI